MRFPIGSSPCSCWACGSRPSSRSRRPFTLIRVPRLFKVLFALGLSASLLSAHPGMALLSAAQIPALTAAAVHELGLGVMIVLAFQLAFGALYLAGRTIDIQAGFGLSVLIDPATQGAVPMVGTLFRLRRRRGCSSRSTDI